MGDLKRILSKPGFNPEDYVSNISSEDGEDKLLETKQNVQILADETAQALKKNVYKNYSQFIETAKEISVLEGEMYQLSHMLTEQKSLMSTMMEMSLISDKAIVDEAKEEKEQENPEEDSRRNLAFLLEKVEGCSSVTEVPGRQLIHNGELTELDPETFSPNHAVHAFLLNDSLMIASLLPHRRGPVRFRFQGLYELDSLAVVNVRDVDTVKNAFKILMFPDSRIYQTDSAKSKRQWLDILEDSKKKKAARDKQKKEAAMRLAEQQATVAHTSVSSEPSNPFEENSGVLQQQNAIENSVFNTDWLQELPEDSDMCIAQRDFEGAVDLVERVNEFLKDCPRTPEVKEFKARIDHRIKQLTEGLMSELQVTPERSLRGGPRAARRAVTQLIRLGKSAQACELFLNNRSAIIKYNIRQLKFEGSTTLYIKRLCTGFFSSLAETGKEFMKAFPQNYGCYSAIVVWSHQELKIFVDMFKRQVFGGKSNLSIIAECVMLARQHCQELHSIGLDLSFTLDLFINDDIKRVIQETKDHIIEGVKYRAADDLWRPMNHLSKTACDRFIEDMQLLGFSQMSTCVYDDCFVNLTINTVQFTKTTLIFVDDTLKMYTPDLGVFINNAIADIFKAHILHIQNSLKRAKFAKDQTFIMKNAQFILEEFLGIAETFYRDKDIVFPKELISVNNEFRRLKTLAKSLS
ncbi:Hypothetical predicted protein [Octopus vulgaris]|uniref:Exocyst complex component 8 n=1 Tax=Octopus vulgaris TaxID=6645 RepID=A0AA36FET1_OCTVU|nr:Hypothetical predicted protein [Octopus vulgaris]